MKVDLRSDTVTQANEAMKTAMVEAKVGDDVFGDDPSVIQLEQRLSNDFAQEAGLFCPSGTMCNQIAIQVHGRSPGEVICSDLAHIYQYEGGGIAFNSRLSTNLLSGDRGRFSLEQLQAAIRPDDIHFAPSRLVSIENTCNKGGGSVWDLNEIKRISQYCKSIKMPLHLDGARIYNALVASGNSSKEMGREFDSLSICLSKGLGAPVGSVLLGSKEFIHKARRIRKIFGGGMRQAGHLAAAGLYALDHQVERIAEDHKRAIDAAEILRQKSFVEAIEPVETNIVLFRLAEDFPAEKYLEELNSKGIAAVGMGKQSIRFVFHLGVLEEQFNYLLHQI